MKKMIMFSLALIFAAVWISDASAAYQCPQGSRYAPNTTGQGYCLYENITLPQNGNARPYCGYLSSHRNIGFSWDQRPENAGYQCPPNSRYAPNNSGQGYCLYENITLPEPGVKPYCEYLANGYIGFMWSLSAAPVASDPSQSGSGTQTNVSKKAGDFRVPEYAKQDFRKLSPVRDLRPTIIGPVNSGPNKGFTEVKLEWEPVQGATGYKLVTYWLKNEYSYGQSSQVRINTDFIVSGQATTFSHFAERGREHRYEVYPKNSAGEFIKEGATGIQVKVPPSPPRVYQFRVAGNTTPPGRVMAGSLQIPAIYPIDITPGSKVKVIASGKVNFGPLVGGRSPAGEAVKAPDNSNFVAPGLRKYALVYKAGNGPWHGYCGVATGCSGFSGNGWLYMMPNDDFMMDNSGDWDVRVEVQDKERER